MCAFYLVASGLRVGGAGGVGCKCSLLLLRQSAFAISGCIHLFVGQVT